MLLVGYTKSLVILPDLGMDQELREFSDKFYSDNWGSHEEATLNLGAQHKRNLG